MALIGTVPRRCVNLPPGSLRTLIRCVLNKRVQEGPELQAFYAEFSKWLGVPHVFGAAQGRSAFQLALEALGLEKGKEIVFPNLTFPVMPMVAQLMGYKPVFCEVDPKTFNAGPEHIEAKITTNTGAVLATHLFGQPAPIREIASLTQAKGIRLMEDCAHACGVRVEGQQVGTFGDIGIYSFAEGKNMPCFAGGAIATSDETIAQRAQTVLDQAVMPPAKDLAEKAFKIWIMWLITRPWIFGLTAYQALRLKLLLGKPLMDSAVGNELLQKYTQSNPRIQRFSNLQAALGRIQLKYIDAFNQGAHRNAGILTECLGEVPGVQAPHAVGVDHIYVYYPLTVDPDKRNDLRNYLLRHGVDSKRTDMAGCVALEAFRTGDGSSDSVQGPTEASILEICVYPVIPEKEMRRIARLIRTWAGLSQ
ncbi:DegT/DnrJ/EryC1/StrS family aminotransferase [Planctomycetota bacterium]